MGLTKPIEHFYEVLKIQFMYLKYIIRGVINNENNIKRWFIKRL